MRVETTNNSYHKNISYRENLNKCIFDKYPYDGKTQVTMNGNSLRVVCSFQNAPAKKLQQLVMEYFEDYPQYSYRSITL